MLAYELSVGLGVVAFIAILAFTQFGPQSPVQKQISRGMDLISKKAFGEALKEFDAAIASDPKAKYAFLGKATAYEQMGEYEQSISNYTLALELSTAEPEAFGTSPGKIHDADSIIYCYRGDAYLKAGQVQKALEDYDTAIRLVPEFPRAYHQRAQAYTNLGNIEQAKNDSDKALKLGYRPE